MKRNRAFIFALLCFFAMLFALILMLCMHEKEKDGLQAPKDGSAVNELKVTFISVGNADSTLVSCGGKHLLVDGGSNYSFAQISKTLKSAGARRLDYIICTHPHEDHMGSLDKIITRYDIGAVFCPVADYYGGLFGAFRTAVTESEAGDISVPDEGDCFSLGDAKVVFLTSGGYNEDENDMSLVFKVIYRNTSILFMGDAGFAVENSLIDEKADLKCDILKVSHHGGKSGTSEKFISECAPDFAVISVGVNADGLPSDQVIERLEKNGISVFRTDIFGDITFVSDGETFYIE